MKDTKPRVTIVTNNIHTTHYANGEYDIDLVFPLREKYSSDNLDSYQKKLFLR